MNLFRISLFCACLVCSFAVHAQPPTERDFEKLKEEVDDLKKRLDGIVATKMPYGLEVNAGITLVKNLAKDSNFKDLLKKLILAGLGNPEFRQQVAKMTRVKLKIITTPKRDVFINGVHWVALKDESHVWVPLGTLIVDAPQNPFSKIINLATDPDVKVVGDELVYTLNIP